MESLAPHISKRLAVFSGVKHPPHGEISRLPDSAAISSIQLIQLVALTVFLTWAFSKPFFPDR